ncbi:hypothetical protein AAVH_41141 [Aphelenchoides avenae]|nr:hypothetical protein AAVH_41141 [Aphelenchus avenae]
MKIDPLSLHAANGAGPNGASSRRKRQSIPTSFDYRTYPSASQSWVSPVKNQGICGSCWAFATAAMHESVNRRYYGNFWDDYSEQILVDCTKGASISDTRYTGLKNLGCDGGWVQTAITYIRTAGMTYEPNYPYTSGATDVEGTCHTPTPFWKGNLVYEYVASEADIDDFVYHTGPVGFMFAVPDAFQNYAGGVFDLSSCTYTGSAPQPWHEMVIVGYTPSYWIVKNSWGPTWANAGYAYFARGKNLCSMQTMLVGAYPSGFNTGK